MKILVLSDVHGCIDGLNAIWAREKQADKVLFLGDMVDWGFNPHEAVQWLREREAICVSGNHDRAMVEAWDSGRYALTDAPYTFTEYTLDKLTAEDVAWLRALPLKQRVTLDGGDYFMKHSPEEGDIHQFERTLLDHTSLPWFENLWAAEMEGFSAPMRTILIGHSHQAMQHVIRRDARVLNPGAVAYRLGRDALAKGSDYMVIQDGEVMLRHVDYPVEHLTMKVLTGNFREDVYTPSLTYFSGEGLEAGTAEKSVGREVKK